MRRGFPICLINYSQAVCFGNWKINGNTKACVLVIKFYFFTAYEDVLRLRNCR